MKAISIEQLYATLKSISQSVFKHISKAQETANKAQETADDARDVLETKMQAENPVAYGSFAMNVENASSVPQTGEYSFAAGYKSSAKGKYASAIGLICSADGECSNAEGNRSSATGNAAHAEGASSEAIGNYSHAEGCYTAAKEIATHAEGQSTVAEGKWSHAEGLDSIAQGVLAHSEGWKTIARAYGHAEGLCTKAGAVEHVHGAYNIESPDTTRTLKTVFGVQQLGAAKYLHVVGNGSDDEHRSNAHTLDWDGNAWYAGTVEGTGMIVRSTTTGSNKRFMITVDDSGVISATEVEE